MSVIQFFISLVQGNCVVGIKKKRPLTIDMSDSPPAKISKLLRVLPKDGASFNAMSAFSNTSSSNVTIVDITNKTGQEIATILADELDCPAEIISPEVTAEGAVGILEAEANVQSLEQASSLQGEGVEDLGDEILDSILATEDTSVAPYQSEVELNRVAIQDHINGIDSSFEELQALLRGKQFNVQPKFISNMSEWPDSNIQGEELALSPGSSKGNEVAQCTPSHVLTLLDELCSSLGMEKSQVEEPPVTPRAESSSPKPRGDDLVTHTGQPTG
ncbi:hypothetical protein Z043_107509 [Scleropages formosus]|uniref:Vertebrate heat shock transcription factor C-terminal domain-containing protein n=1 Tax=Scleropages formosus TaxID=113540 RepID=A0A0P7VII6_SCLFO|nr:hypothetical protein Z043_107509 [Scleropages formosus]